METFFIVIGVGVMACFCFWLFGIEPRRKIYDQENYDR